MNILNRPLFFILFFMCIPFYSKATPEPESTSTAALTLLYSANVMGEHKACG